MRHSIFLFTACLLAVTPAIAADQPGEQSPAIRPAPRGPAMELSTGLEHQEGDYGTGERIETLSVPTSLRIGVGQVQFSATLPYLRIDAPGNVVGGGGTGFLGLPIIVDPTQPAARERREGIGDLRLGAAYTVPSAAVGLTFTGQLKVPTASERKGLGTGEFDYAVGAELSKTLGRVTPFVGVGYTMPGDPEGFDLRNSLSARAGLAAQMGPRVRGHVAYGYAQSLSPLFPDEQQISTGLNAGISDRLSLGIYGNAGLSEGAPDIGAGVQIGFRLF